MFVRLCSGSIELWKWVKERGRVWFRVKLVCLLQYVLVIGLIGFVIYLMILLVIFFNDLFVFFSNVLSFVFSSFLFFFSRFFSLFSFVRFFSFFSSFVGGRRQLVIVIFFRIIFCYGGNFGWIFRQVICLFLIKMFGEFFMIVVLYFSLLFLCVVG